MTRFPLDAALQSYAALLLGWACYARPMVAKEAKNQGAKQLCETAMKNFGER